MVNRPQNKSNLNERAVSPANGSSYYGQKLIVRPWRRISKK
jgi:hypothetical protein